MEFNEDWVVVEYQPESLLEAISAAWTGHGVEPTRVVYGEMELIIE